MVWPEEEESRDVQGEATTSWMSVWQRPPRWQAL